MKFEYLKWIREASSDELVDIALKLISAHPDTFEDLVRVGPRIFTAKWENGGSVTVSATAEHLVEFKKLNGPGDKIACIRKIREIYGVGLKEAKEISENLDFMKAINAGWVCPHTNTTLEGLTSHQLSEKLCGRHY